MQFIVCFIIFIYAGWIAYKRNSISFSGFIALIAICFLFFALNSANWFLVLFAMFITSSALTRYNKQQKSDIDEVLAKSGPRDAIQAFANFGAPIAFFVTYQFHESGYISAAFVGSIAGVTADSWASEIGGLSKQKPRMITNFKHISRGISGGITALGTFAGVLGSVFISFIGFYLLSFSVIIPNLFQFVISTFIGGVFGLIMDSVIGAKWQVLYQNDCGLTERDYENGRSNKLIKGYRYINNDVVNLLSSILAGVCSLSLYLLI